MFKGLGLRVEGLWFRTRSWTGLLCLGPSSYHMGI